MQDLPDAAPVLILLPGLTGAAAAFCNNVLAHFEVIELHRDSSRHALRQAVQTTLTCSMPWRAPGMLASGLTHSLKLSTTWFDVLAGAALPCCGCLHPKVQTNSATAAEQWSSTAEARPTVP